MRIGILGGSFNPPHNGHILNANSLLKSNYIDKVILVPTGEKYNKPELAPAKDRLKMASIAVKEQKNIYVSDYEQKRNLVYAFETLNYFQKQYPNDEIFFICGSDNLEKFDTWREYKYILQHYKLLVMKRSNLKFPEKLNNYRDRITFVETKSTLSSSSIREIIQENAGSEFLRTNLNKNVLKYIKKRKLYGKNKLQIRRGLFKTL